MVIFYANDYQLCAYIKKYGSKKWFFETNYTATVPVIVQESIFNTFISKKEVRRAAALSLADGKLIKPLPWFVAQNQVCGCKGIRKKMLVS